MKVGGKDSKKKGHECKYGVKQAQIIYGQREIIYSEHYLRRNSER